MQAFIRRRPGAAALIGFLIILLATLASGLYGMNF
jgi:hypothetical protein